MAELAERAACAVSSAAKAGVDPLPMSKPTAKKRARTKQGRGLLCGLDMADTPYLSWKWKGHLRGEASSASIWLGLVAVTHLKAGFCPARRSWGRPVGDFFSGTCVFADPLDPRPFK